MCGRYGFFHDASVIGPLFNVEALDLKPRYNIAPSQEVPVVRLDDELDREMALVRWGLIPYWVKNPEEFKANLGKNVLFPKRLGRADELASMVVECATNSYMNGETIRVDGGIRMPPK
jgi:NAD(P)-dependent dehydrogenase (short-subunit alcohol dehydrogenase family)